MTPSEYAAKLRRAADVIESTGAEVIYQVCYDCYSITLPSFLRIFAGQTVATKQNCAGVEAESSVDGIRFYAYLEDEQSKTIVSSITLPPL